MTRVPFCGFVDETARHPDRKPLCLLPPFPPSLPQRDGTVFAYVMCPMCLTKWVGIRAWGCPIWRDPWYPRDDDVADPMWYNVGSPLIDALAQWNTSGTGAELEHYWGGPLPDSMLRRFGLMEKGSNENNMNAERRKRLQQKVQAEKTINAGVSPGAVNAASEPATLLAFGKHFFSEIQADDDGNDVFAVYRATDLLANADGAVDPVPPVHVFDLANDAAIAIVVLDKLVDAIEKEDAVGVELPVMTQPVVTPTEPLN